MTRAPRSPPPLRGRDREGGDHERRSLLLPPSPTLPRKGGGGTPSVRRAPRATPDMALVMFVVVTMVMMMVTMTVMMMPMLVPMIMMVIMPMLMMMYPLVRAAAARVLAEQQRLDRHRHGVGRHADAPEIDVVEIAQHHPVDSQDLALDQKLLAQDRAERLRNVAVEHDVDRLPALNRGGKAVADAFGESGDTLVGRRAQPAQRQRHLALAFNEIK